jgi:hypothetical protein
MWGVLWQRAVRPREWAAPALLRQSPECRKSSPLNKRPPGAPLWVRCFRVPRVRRWLGLLGLALGVWLWAQPELGHRA